MDSLIQSAKEIEALREKVAELTADVSFWNTTFLEAREGYEKELAAMTQERDASIKNEQAIRLLMECYQLGGCTDHERLARDLLLAQARIKELREALERCESMFDYHYIGTTVAQEALATPDDSSALDELLEEAYSKGYDVGCADTTGDT